MTVDVTGRSTIICIRQLKEVSTNIGLETVTADVTGINDNVSFNSYFFKIVVVLNTCGFSSCFL